MFQHLTNTLTHPAALPVIGMLLLVLQVFLILSVVSPGTEPRKPKFSDNPLMNALGWIGAVLTVPVLIILTAVGWELIVMAWNFPALDIDDSKLRHHSSLMLAMLAAFGAIFTLIFAYIRSFATERQTRATEEGLITDRINKAVQGLGADKSEKRQRTDKKGNPTYRKKMDGKDDYSQPVMIEETAPNLEVRIGSIYALERIAQDSDRDHVQIMEIICSYIRNNAPARSAKKSPHEVHRQLKAGDEASPPLNDEEIFQHQRYEAANTIGVTPDELNDLSLKRWSWNLPMPRDDIEVALRVLGRRRHLKKESQSDYRLDLRNTNLQRSQLTGKFGKAHFSDSRLDGSKLSGNFTECDFTLCSLQAISCRSIECQKSDFSFTNMSSAVCVGSEFTGSVFWFALLDHIQLNDAKMRACDFYRCIPKHVIFGSSPLC